MSGIKKFIIIFLILTIIALVVVAIGYSAYKKGTTGSDVPAPPPSQSMENETNEVMGRFDLGEFVVNSRDEELHYVKIQIEICYVGNVEQELEEYKAELRDTVNITLMKYNAERLKEDYIDRFLHAELLKELNTLLGKKKKKSLESCINKIVIPTFLIN